MTGRRPRSLAILAAGALAAGPARGAEITSVLSGGEAGSPFALRLDVRYERAWKGARITREFGDNGSDQPGTGVVRDAVELRYSEVTDRLVPRLAVGLARDLELRLQMPYVLDFTPHWDYGKEGGASVQSRSAIDLNTIHPSGGSCAAAPCPMFPVGRKLHAGGAFDDLQIGVAWVVTSERRDPPFPTWVVSLDVTVPTATRYDPAAGRLDPATYPSSFFDAPGFGGGSKAAVGHKIWVYDLATAFSRRLGFIEPYLQARVRIPQRSGATYSNCEHAAELAALPDAQMSSVAPANCAAELWRNRARAEPPLVAGFLLGAELASAEVGPRSWVDLRLGANFHGSGRWYGELTPATGKLLASDPYLDFVARVAVAYQTERALVGLRYSFQGDLAHFITGEGMGRVPRERVSPGSPEQNPNFDFRWDPPGRRFRAVDSLTHSLSLELAFAY